MWVWGAVIVVFCGFSMPSCGVLKKAQQVQRYDAKKHTDVMPVVVIGGGVAGLTAANYLLQANIPTVVLEGAKPGGALAQSDSVRNWPGVNNVPGGAIVGALKAQVVANGGIITPEELVSLDVAEWPYRCTVRHKSTGVERSITMLSAIVAMGASPHYLGVPGESGADGYWGKGVTNCAICDGALYKNKRVVVIGGGDAAMVEAAYLAGIANHVTVLVRGSALRARDRAKVTQVQAMPNVTMRFNTVVQEIYGDSMHVQGVRVVSNGSAEQLAADGVFLAIGASPNTRMLPDSIMCDEQGYIIVDSANQTSVEGIFAAGDVMDPVYKQAVVSAGDGCKAALGAVAFIHNVGYTAPEREHGEAVNATDQGASMINTFMPEITTTEAFAELLQKSQKLLLVDIGADYCISCQEVEPIINAIAQQYADTIAVASIKANNKAIDMAMIMALCHGQPLEQVPTLLVIKQQHEVARLTDTITSATIQGIINQYR